MSGGAKYSINKYKDPQKKKIKITTRAMPAIRTLCANSAHEISEVISRLKLEIVSKTAFSRSLLREKFSEVSALLHVLQKMSIRLAFQKF